MALRVLRLIEYVYVDEQTAADDMARWTHANRSALMTMRSATLAFEAVEWSKTVDRDKLRALVLDYTNQVEGPKIRLEGQARPEVDGMTDDLLELLRGT